MRVLITTHSFNSLAQRIFVELRAMGHEVSVEFDINESVLREAVELFRPDLIIAPFLKRRIPEDIWRPHRCIIVHPGIVGDRGPSALDWAILNGEVTWGVTLLQAIEEMDAGPIWASATFPIREGTKSSLYRHEVTDTAVTCLRQVIERAEVSHFRPEPLDYSKPGVKGERRRLMKQSDRRIDWSIATTKEVLLRMRGADGFPGVLDEMAGMKVHLYGAHAEDTLRGAPGSILAQRNGAICRATVDGAVWITHLRPKPPKGHRRMKLPAATVLRDHLDGVPEIPDDPFGVPDGRTYREIWYQEEEDVGYLYFPFYNGAMGTRQCERLLKVYRQVRKRDVKVIVLMGGPDFWCNGMNLNLIEAAESPAGESWRNINAMDDLAREIIDTTDRLVIGAMEGNAGAGGVFLALATDMVVVREGIVLNPHYKSMGNLYGSEYWTYLLPRRVGREASVKLTENRLPLGVQQARRLGLIDDILPNNSPGFRRALKDLAVSLARDTALKGKLTEKAKRRFSDEAEKPLEAYRSEELDHMRLNFYGFDPSYHVARHNFVYKRPLSRTPPYLAVHRRLGWRTPKGVVNG